MFWTYTALTSSGQEITETVAGHKEDILKHLSTQRYFVIRIEINYRQTVAVLLRKKRISTVALGTFFEDLSNMLEAGMSITQTILILKETSREESLIYILPFVEERLRNGQSLTESLQNSKLFPWIVTMTISAGEKTGRLIETTHILGEYFKRIHQIQNKLQQVLIYPSLVLVLLLMVMIFISFRVIPQLKVLLPAQALHNQTTQFILVVSSLLKEYFWILIITFFLGFLFLYFLIKRYRNFIEEWTYNLPIIGSVLKESALAIYLLNLSILLKSGVSLIKAIEALNVSESTLTSREFLRIREYIIGGTSLSQALEQNKFFPTIISLTLRRAEEMVKVDEYCSSLAEYFHRRVDAKAGGLLHIIQPALLGLGGAFLIIIALGFIVPVYSSLNIIAEGK